MTTPEIRIPKAISFTFNNKASSSMFGLPAFLLSPSSGRDLLLSLF